MLNGEPRAPACSPALEDVAASPGRHAGTEAVLAQAGDALRLPGPFHRTLLRVSNEYRVYGRGFIGGNGEMAGGAEPPGAARAVTQCTGGWMGAGSAG